MQQFRRLLAALDLSSMDKDILKFLAVNASLLGVEKAYFLHIMPDFSSPRNMDVEFQKLFAPEYPIDEKVKDKLSLDAEEIVGKDTFSYDIEVIEGKPYEKLLRWVKIKEIGLLVVGKKAFSEGSGITAKRVTRNAGCNVLILPTGAEANIRRVVVPLDFSANSLKALNSALSLKRLNEELKVEGVYVVDLPPDDYYSRSKPGSGYRGVLMESAKAAYHQFTEEHDIDLDTLEMKFLENTGNSVARHLQDFAEQQSGTLVLMGAKGHSPFENFLFGSVTEKLADAPSAVPILVVR